MALDEPFCRCVVANNGNTEMVFTVHEHSSMTTIWSLHEEYDVTHWSIMIMLRCIRQHRILAQGLQVMCLTLILDQWFHYWCIH